MSRLWTGSSLAFTPRPEPLDRGEQLRPGLTVSFEHPADFRAVITPAHVRLLQEIGRRAVSIFALAAALSRDPLAVRPNVALLEPQSLVRTRRVRNPGHATRTLLEITAASIELGALIQRRASKLEPVYPPPDLKGTQ